MRRRDIFETALIGFAALAAVIASIAVAPGLPGAFGAGLALLMLAIATIDARYFIIPNGLTAAAFGLALVNAALLGEMVPDGIRSALLRGCVLAAGFLAIRTIYHGIRGRQGIGLGDVKLAGVAGAWLGWTTIPISVEIAAVAALAGYGLRHIVGGREIQATQRIPFGLFFAPAIWLCWLLEVTWLAP